MVILEPILHVKPVISPTYNNKAFIKGFMIEGLMNWSLLLYADLSYNIQNLTCWI
jgi:hypothetical protein